MTAYQQIDLVFLHLKEKINYGGSYGENNLWFYVERTTESGINKTLFGEIIKRLKEDGYVTETLHPEAQPVYHITFKGLLFEGYTKQYESLQDEKDWKKKLELQTLQNSKKLNCLTLILAIGTSIAALYYLLEIVKLICPNSFK